MSVVYDARSAVGGLHPVLQRLTTRFRSAQLDVDRRPKLGKKGVDLHRYRPNDDTANFLLPAGLERAFAALLEYIDVTTERHSNGRHPSREQRALDAHVGYGGGEQSHQVLEELLSVGATALREHCGNARLVEGGVRISHGHEYTAEKKWPAAIGRPFLEIRRNAQNDNTQPPLPPLNALLHNDCTGNVPVLMEIVDDAP